jgi:RNA polymerase sigma factor (sigma-70 family)
LVEDIGNQGIRNVLSKETAEGPDFFRAVDMVKKRAQREKTFQTLDEQQSDIAAKAGGDGASADWRGALQEAINRTLNSREADLIQATLQGKTPSEIAAQWGVASKTVSNEKTRAIQKLREALVGDIHD